MAQGEAEGLSQGRARVLPGVAVTSSFFSEVHPSRAQAPHAGSGAQCLAPQSQAIQTRPSSTPPSRSPQRVHLEVGLEEVDDGHIAGCLAVGHGARFQDEPLLRAVRVGELVDEAGLPHAGFPHDGDELAVAIVREGERPADLLDLGVSADEPGQSPRGGRVEAGPLRARSGERVDLHGLRQALTATGPRAATCT